MKKVIKKTTKKKLKTTTSLENKLWTLFSIFIRKRDAIIDDEYIKCVTCGKVKHWKQVDAGHWITRGCKATKFDERNVHAQCKQCNKWGSGKPAIHENKIIEMYGVEVRDELLELSKTTRHFNRYELEELIEKYS